MLGVGECRNAIDEALRALGRTSTIWPRDATKPLECARTRYGPGDSVRSSKRPARSVTANADVVPRADTIPPAREDREAPDRRAPRTPLFWLCFALRSPGSALVLRRADRENDLPGQRLVRELVRHLDFEPVIALGERRQWHRLTALQLMAGREVELRRQRLRIEALRVRLVEELLRLAGGLLIEVVLDAHVRLVRAVHHRVVDQHEGRQFGLLREFGLERRHDFHPAERVRPIGLLLRRQRG